MAPPYRASPDQRPVVALREFTAPLGVGRGAALVLLAAGFVGATVPVAEEFECIQGERVDCKLTTHRGLYTTERKVDLRGLEGVTTTRDFDLPLRRAVELLEMESDGRRLPLPTRGIYYDPRDVWRRDGGLVETARRFFQSGSWGYFAVLQRAEGDALAWAALSVVAPLAGLAWLLFAERKTRRVSLTVDPNARTAHARSAGLGGRAIDRAAMLGVNARAERIDDAMAGNRPLLRLVSDDGAPLPLLTGHVLAHGAAFDRIALRANRALAHNTPADGSPSIVARFGPSALLALALVALVARVVTQREALVPITGRLAITSSLDRCELEGLTLQRGARLELSALVGVTTRTLTVRMPDGATRTAPVSFSVRPGGVATFDCARLRETPPAGGFRATPAAGSGSR